MNGDDVIMIKDGEAQVGTEEDVALYKQMRAFIRNNDMSDPDNYARACGMIDVQSCIDYYATEIYITNLDWPSKNKGLWRTRGTESGRYGDGRWRWVLFDVNVAMSMKRVEKDYVAKTIKNDSLFASLMQNESFAAAFYSRMVELAENEFNPIRTETWIRDYEVYMQDAVEKEFVRFYNGKRDGATCINACEAILDFLRDASANALEKYSDYIQGA